MPACSVKKDKKICMCLPAGKSEPLDLPHISSYQEVGEYYQKKQNTGRKSDPGKVLQGRRYIYIPPVLTTWPHFWAW